MRRNAATADARRQAGAHSFSKPGKSPAACRESVKSFADPARALTRKAGGGNNARRMKKLPLPLLAAFAAAAFTGCNSIQSHSEGAYTSASETASHYESLGSTIATAKSRLQSLRKVPGGPETFLKSIEETRSLLVGVGGDLRDTREDLLSHGNDHAKLLDEQADKFTDMDMARKIRRDAQDLRERYAAFDKDSAPVTESLELALRYCDDVIRMMDINRTSKGVDNCLGTVAKIEETLESARGKIPAAKSALEELRKHLPKPATA